MSIYFNNRNQSYVVAKKNGDTYKSYSVNAYGKYAEILANVTNNTGEKFKNYYEFTNESCIIKIYSKKYGYLDVFVDLDMYDIIKHIRWCVTKGRNTFYCRGKIKINDKWKNVKLHRIVTDYDDFVDHINGNGLDNRRVNLRETDNSLNQKNRISKSKIFPNVTLRYDKNGNCRFNVRWKENGKTITESYSVNKYGYHQARLKAIKKSIKERKNNNYIVKEKIVKIIRVK
jgi:hypothetical protein